MGIAPQLENQQMNIDQQAIIGHKQGPLLVIAGPGSGKTHSITLLAMNLLLCGDARPENLVLCTYTEKAAHEMQDRLTSIANEVNYPEDLSQLKIDTIHGLCNRFITENLHQTPLGNNYELLDQFTQRLLIYEHLDTICAHGIQTFFTQRWGSPWKIAHKLQFFFDKIVEELIFAKLKSAYPKLRHYPADQDTFRCCLTHAYIVYQKILAQKNRIDFAHLQKCAYNLLEQESVFQKITKDMRYILVDEYQDTNYIQEQILKRLAEATGSNNLCVVGDEDQALYRFRGATVRNILEFAEKFPGCKQVHLTTNYRSHHKIIDFYNQWMSGVDWSNSGGIPSRTQKTIRAIPDETYAAYAAVFCVLDDDTYREAEQFAEIVHSLKKHGKIHDYNEVALLLQSVRTATSEVYIEALREKSIPAFCPRARAYFTQDIVRLLVACFVRIIGYQEKRHVTIVERSFLPTYINECLTLLQQQCQVIPQLEAELQAIEDEIMQVDEADEATHRQLADYFYRIIFTEPFAGLLSDENELQNLVLFSQLLQTFQQYYRHTMVASSTLLSIEDDLFHTFFCLLYEDGIDQYEDPHQPFPPGHVQVMTIHQAKGLEFSVIAVGRMDKKSPKSETEEQVLQSFYHQEPFEPDRRIPAFDLRRLYYVAFSRAKNLLILTANKKPQPHFVDLWQSLPTWTQIRWDIHNLPAFKEREAPLQPKPRYSFTGHIQLYETCPRQFQFFRVHNFQPVHSIDAFAGLLVHQTLEHIHRLALDNQLATMNEKGIRAYFETAHAFLLLTNMQPIDDEQKARAWQQVLNYFYHNYQEMQQIRAAEMNIQVEKHDYVLTGTIDLLRYGQSGLEVVDFKTRTRPAEDSEHLPFYKQQLYLYAYALKRRTGDLPKRLLLYWTAEEKKENALMEIPFTNKDVQQVSDYFDGQVARIKQRTFTVLQPPAPHICKTCDIRQLCTKQGII